MTIIVEDGSLIANANSYVSAANLTAFATARNISLTGDASILLIQAMDYIETLNYKGRKRSRDQALQWPRFGVVVDTYPIDSTVIPNELKNGQMQTALAIDAGNGPQQVIPRKTIREKIGDLEVEYAAGAVTSPMDVKINGFLWKLLDGGGYGANVINITKG